MTPSQFFWRHLRVPLLLFVLLAPLLAMSRVDLGIAHALYFDEAAGRWIGASSWWTNELIHAGGAWLIRSMAVAALLLWAATWRWQRWRHVRRPALFFALSVTLSVALVGLLKAVTNIDCPRDLSEFGGSFPYIHLFAHRPSGLRHARCFPAAHASAGYALLALYFVFRERSRWAGRLGWATGIGMGLIFGLAQQSRGAHFVSHDVWSAMLVWTVSLSLYTFAFKACLWNTGSLHRSAWDRNEVDFAAHRLRDGGAADLPQRMGSAPRT